MNNRFETGEDCICKSFFTCRLCLPSPLVYLVFSSGIYAP